MEWVSPKELARRLGISRRSVFRLVSTGKLPEPVHLTARIVRWDWRVVQQFLSSNANRSGSTPGPGNRRAVRRHGR